MILPGFAVVLLGFAGVLLGFVGVWCVLSCSNDQVVAVIPKTAGCGN